MRRYPFLPLLALILMLVLSSCAFAASVDSVLTRWTKKFDMKDDLGSELFVDVTYYSAEYVEALVQSEAQKNLWTQDEMETYKYELLKTLKLNDYLTFNIKINNLGPSMHMAPFDSHLTLFIGGEKYEPVDYDKRFNFKLQGEREGLVYFPRYDEKTGNPVLGNVKTIKLKIDGRVGGIASGKKMDFFWDVKDDDPEKLYTGKAASKLELERLIRRLEKLNEEKQDLQAKLADVQQKINEVSARIDVLEQ